ncbi:hypothetical protein ACH5RR_011314 [Cinchona calisaya]|uniref:Uncharacterized protein n=1 Tax=Cinchona calisaya TaxID=153742 RepID=A0ABD3A618_9GENT
MVVAKTSRFWQWNSPLPFLFFGLGAMVILITIALIILACSYRKRPSNDDEEKSSAKAVTSTAGIMMPQIVVIMAGDENPTQLAVPVSSLPNTRSHDQDDHQV